MTKQDIKRAIRTLKAEHDKSAQRDHVEGLLTAALQCVEKLKGTE